MTVVAQNMTVLAQNMTGFKSLFSLYNIEKFGTDFLITCYYLCFVNKVNLKKLLCGCIISYLKSINMLQNFTNHPLIAQHLSPFLGINKARVKYHPSNTSRLIIR